MKDIYQWFPVHKDHRDSDFFQHFWGRFGHVGHSVWITLLSLWQEPFARVEEREIDGGKVKGLCRKPTLDYLCRRFDLGAKRTADILLYLADCSHIILDADSREVLERIQRRCRGLGEYPERGSRELQEKIGIFWPKLLEFRNKCFRQKRERSRIDRYEEEKGEDVSPHLQELLRELIQEKCPQCGEIALVIKKGRYGEFVSCSRWPDCDYKRSIDADSSRGPSYDYPGLDSPPKEPEMTEEEKERASEARRECMKIVDRLARSRR
jgi:hypothetical protein